MFQGNLSYNDAVEEALCFGWMDGVKRSIDDDHYMHQRGEKLGMR